MYESALHVWCQKLMFIIVITIIIKIINNDWGPDFFFFLNSASTPLLSSSLRSTLISARAHVDPFIILVWS